MLRKKKFLDDKKVKNNKYFKTFKTGLFFCYVLEFIPVDLNTRYTELNHPHYKQYTSSW